MKKIYFFDYIQHIVSTIHEIVENNNFNCLYEKAEMRIFVQI